jgi:hypothetical protein
MPLELRENKKGEQARTKEAQKITIRRRDKETKKEDYEVQEKEREENYDENGGSWEETEGRL